jgi:hypothetical protein
MKRDGKRPDCKAAAKPASSDAPPVSADWERYLILITCRDEREQVELLKVLQAEGLTCRALLS